MYGYLRDTTLASAFIATITRFSTTIRSEFQVHQFVSLTHRDREALSKHFLRRIFLPTSNSKPRVGFACVPITFLPLSLCLLASPWRISHAQENSNGDWPTYGGGLAAQHYSKRTQIDRSNVQNLAVAWSFHTGALRTSGSTNQRSSFEANPVLWNGILYLDTPYNEVFALDATSGREIWRFDPHVSHNTPFGIVASRGVALWHGAIRGGANCESDRVIVATLDRRLLELDAINGSICRGFGHDGAVDLAESLHLTDTRWYSFTSPITVVGDVVAVGSSVGDNQLVEAPSGMIRGFDAQTGKLLWNFEPLPWAQIAKQRSGSGGAWSVISADPEMGMLFVPTGSPSVDFYGANRPGDNKDANSVIALDVQTGRRIWGFQVVHHDLWDFDVAAEPLLFTFREKTPAVAVTTKMGMIFVLDRRTGIPLYPVEERAVPRSDIPGEQTSTTQPFSSLPAMVPMTINVAEIQGRDASETAFCRKRIASLVYKGAYTPVGLRNTLLFPGSTGGVNWGSAALDPSTGILYANVNQLAYEVRLVPRTQDPRNFWSVARSLLQESVDFWRNLLRPNTFTGPPHTDGLYPPDSGGYELSEQAGTPYRIYRAPILSPSGLPCTPQPWGALIAVDLNQGKKRWTTPLGTMVTNQLTGAVTVGGPIVTAGGLIFTGGGVEPLLRAYDAKTGQELWRGALPAAAQSTPMTYQINGKQYVVVTAGGHGSLALTLGDAVVAFALPPNRINGGNQVR